MTCTWAAPRQHSAEPARSRAGAFRMDHFSFDEMDVTEPRTVGIDVQEQDSMPELVKCCGPGAHSPSATDPAAVQRDSATGFPGPSPSSGTRATNAGRSVRYASHPHDLVAVAKTDVAWHLRRPCQIRVPQSIAASAKCRDARPASQRVRASSIRDWAAALPWRTGTAGP